MPFTDELKAFVRQNITDERLDSFIEDLTREMPGFLDEAMEANLRQRADVLQKAVRTPSFSPARLGMLTRTLDMDNFLKT